MLALALDPALLPVLALPLLTFIVYWEALQGDWVSDDLEGMAIYDGKWQTPKWKWGNALKKLRYEMGKVPNPDHDWRAKQLPPFLSSPKRHHRFSLFIGGASLVALYAFLCPLFGPPVAFLTTLLFLAHPVGAQCLAWISGIGYLLGFFFGLLGLNYALLMAQAPWFQTPHGYLVGLVGYGLLQLLAVEAMFATAPLVLVLAYLGLWPFAAVGSLVAVYGVLNTFREAITLRVGTFKEQQLGQTTKLYGRKAITVLKTLAYYVRLTVFPKRLGLYHTFGYHYELPYVEWEDKHCWAGVGVAAAGVGAFLLGPPPVRFAVVWWVACGVIFWNWITANQFVADRYIWWPTVGACLLVATYAPAWVYWLVLGIALMRTWAHIPTFFDHIRFYQSNLWNFPDSEVAMGNLGILHRDRGFIGTGLELWAAGAKVNPRYDVNWYNLSSHLRANGPFAPNYTPGLLSLCPPEVQQAAFNNQRLMHLILARYCLQRSLEAPTCHFPERWRKELAELEQQMQAPGVPFPRLVRPLPIGTGPL